MDIGYTFKVYRKVDEREETCSHGTIHRVPIYSVKRLTIVRIESEMIKALHYTHDGYGDVLYATDAQGREYRKEPHWDGPRATLWVRTEPVYGRGVTFTQYPTNKFSRGLDNRPLSL
jgi:hypothetical protein